MENEKTHDTFIKFLLGVVQNRQVRDGVLESLLYSRMRSFFTFGYGGLRTDSEQDQFEREMDLKRQEDQESYISEREERNKYPGLEERERRQQKSAQKKQEESMGA